MATVTIILTDNADSSTAMRVEFDPPLERDDEPTEAQAMALDAVRAITNDNEVGDLAITEPNGTRHQLL